MTILTEYTSFLKTELTTLIDKTTSSLRTGVDNYPLTLGILDALEGILSGLDNVRDEYEKNAQSPNDLTVEAFYEHLLNLLKAKNAEYTNVSIRNSGIQSAFTGVINSLGANVEMFLKSIKDGTVPQMEQPLPPETAPIQTDTPSDNTEQTPRAIQEDDEEAE